MYRILSFAIVVVVAALCASTAVAQTPPIPNTLTLRVATRVVPPFVFREQGELTGFSVDLWNAISKELGAKSEFLLADDVAGLLGDVASGKADLGIAAISITSEREKTFDFSQPMFDGGLQIATAATPKRDAGPFASFWNFVLSKSFLEVLAVIFVLMLLPAPFIWLAERNSGEELLQAKTRIGQFGQAIWWSICALGGQAQDMPSRTAGRLIAIPWLMFAVLFASYFTAAVTARLTVGQLQRGIESVSDLPGRRIVTVSNSTASVWLRAHKLAADNVGDIDTAVKMVESGRAEAIVYDEPVLAYLASHDLAKIKTVGMIFQPEHYGLIFLPGDSRRRAVNEILLRLRERGEYQEIKQKWFGNGDE